VFIGVTLDRDRVNRLLTDALLTDAEIAEDEAAWSGYPDPLPTWGVTQQHSH
jgi:hypothetical protein